MPELLQLLATGFGQDEANNSPRALIQQPNGEEICNRFTAIWGPGYSIHCEK